MEELDTGHTYVLTFDLTQTLITLTVLNQS
jgi:hypothetical protein